MAETADAKGGETESWVPQEPRYSSDGFWCTGCGKGFRRSPEFSTKGVGGMVKLCGPCNDELHSELPSITKKLDEAELTGGEPLFPVDHNE